MIYINDVGGNGLGKPRKGFKKFLKVAKVAVAPHTLLLNKRNRKPTAIAPPTNITYNANIDPVVDEDSAEIGLGKVKLKKVLKKVKLKTVIKQVGKVAKFAAPIAAGFIPIAGGTVSKVLDSKIGKTAMKLGRSKVGSVVLSQTGINLPNSNAIPVKRTGITRKPKKKSLLKFKKKSKKLAIGSKGEDVKVLQEQLGVTPDGDFGPKTQQALEQATGQKTISSEAIEMPTQTLGMGSKGEEVKALQEQLGITPDGDFGPKTQQALEQATGQKRISTKAIQMEPMEEAQPQGEMTPIKPYEEYPGTQRANLTAPPAKNNTLLIVGGVAALAGIAYLATKKSNN